MPLMDEFKEEREAMKSKGFRERLSYFWDYYKWHVIGTVVAVVLAGSFIFHVFFGKDTGFYAAMPNTTDLDQAEEYVQRFAEYAGIDTGDFLVTFDTGLYIDNYGEMQDPDMMATSEKLMVSATAAELDVMVTDADTIAYYAYSTYFCDLRTFLTPEQQALYEPYFYYVDLSLVIARLEDAENHSTTLTTDYPDPRDPDAMEQPIPVGLFLDRSQALREAFYFRGEDVVLCVYSNTTRPEAVLKFIDFVMQ